ncbi:hypothetical protein D7294_28305 [Streptomyces hoynatensis]|uniref:Prenyltransferase n=1 Tax=Streptomyces hoynatensis TaxID=1141874 RepID=A0A3A9YLG7_9ACTN|nr:hypothetical protein [Streptomyces hoynatensis]RKN37275.1 hypothetical protein D7294_28305 [Streptomyces hoynatensis]
MPPGRSLLARAEHFVWLTARVLEQRRFAHLFLDGPPEAVETALAAYRNPDHGFGHALLPDLRGPLSQPLHTVAALQILDETGRCHGRHTERICRYLTSVSTHEGALPAVHPSQRGYPAARFLPIPSTGSDLLATGPAVGLLHRNDVWDAWLFRATDYCWSAIERLGHTHPRQALAALAFLDSAPDRARAETVADRLGGLVRDQRLVVTDPDRAHAFAPPAGYGPDELHFVCDYARSPNSLARRWFSEAELARGVAHLAARQCADGGWPARHPAWAPGSVVEWRPIHTIEALLTLRAFGHDLAAPAPAPPSASP